jgi:hypothetical protein
MYKNIMTIGFVLFSSFSGNVYSATEWLYNAKVVRTLSDDVSYGGCMIQINVAPTSVNCPGNWYHLNCAVDKEYGKRTYATALMAFSMDANVQLLVDDSNKINSYCHARRLDLTR